MSLADKIWKATRQEDLEQMLVSRISLALCRPEWEVFAAIDTILADLAAGADERLDWQSKFAVSPEVR